MINEQYLAARSWRCPVRRIGFALANVPLGAKNSAAQVAPESADAGVTGLNSLVN